MGTRRKESSRLFWIIKNLNHQLRKKPIQLKARSLSKKSICFLPKLEGRGGPASFQGRLSQGLAAYGIKTHHDPTRPDCAAILVVGGTHQLLDIWRARQRGVRIVERLDGMNWMHKVRKTGLKHYLRAEWYNRILSFTRRNLADHIVYQSQFSCDWWNSVYQSTRASIQVVYNGVDLNIYSPIGNEKPPRDTVRILVIEANFSGGYESGLENAVDFIVALQQTVNQKVELMITGSASDKLKSMADQKAKGLIRWIGWVPREQIPAKDRSAHMLFSADINAACPNSVVEAMACGLPVIGYATGSLPELVDGDAGRVAPYGNDFWKLEAAQPAGLVAAAADILKRQAHFRKAARTRAEEHFGLEKMTELYLHAFNF
jgi:glycosyltransferase involved in cell wall biosynthesis